jgi:uncharacterized SAM-binding protein YcdF (DUF218 family)
MTIIIVLGGRNDDDGRLTPTAEARALAALDEHRSCPDSRLLLTAGFGHFNRAPEPHAFYMAKYLLERGVPQQSLLPFVLSTNTVEDAVLSSRLLRDREIVFHSICVVTSRVHTARARLIFEHFFSPSVLRFREADNAVASDVLARLEAHERDGIDQIAKQDGVMFDGRLWKRIAPVP